MLRDYLVLLLVLAAFYWYIYVPAPESSSFPDSEGWNGSAIAFNMTPEGTFPKRLRYSKLAAVLNISNTDLGDIHYSIHREWFLTNVWTGGENFTIEADYRTKYKMRGQFILNVTHSGPVHTDIDDFYLGIEVYLPGEGNVPGPGGKDWKVVFASSLGYDIPLSVCDPERGVNMSIYNTANTHIFPFLPLEDKIKYDPYGWVKTTRIIDSSMSYSVGYNIPMEEWRVKYLEGKRVRMNVLVTYDSKAPNGGDCTLWKYGMERPNMRTAQVSSEFEWKPAPKVFCECTTVGHWSEIPLGLIKTNESTPDGTFRICERNTTTVRVSSTCHEDAQGSYQVGNQADIGAWGESWEDKCFFNAYTSHYTKTC